MPFDTSRLPNRAKMTFARYRAPPRRVMLVAPEYGDQAFLSVAQYFPRDNSPCTSQPETFHIALSSHRAHHWKRRHIAIDHIGIR